MSILESLIALRRERASSAWVSTFETSSDHGPKPITWESLAVASPAGSEGRNGPSMWRAQVPGGYLVATQWGNAPVETAYVPCGHHDWKVKLAT